MYISKRYSGYSPKLQTSWEGPFEVVTRKNDVIYRITKIPKGKPQIVQFNWIAPFHGANGADETYDVRVV